MASFARRPYAPPQLRQLGLMSHVTRKTNFVKPGSEFNDPQGPIRRDKVN